MICYFYVHEFVTKRLSVQVCETLIFLFLNFTTEVTSIEIRKISITQTYIAIKRIFSIIQ